MTDSTHPAPWSHIVDPLLAEADRVEGLADDLANEDEAGCDDVVALLHKKGRVLRSAAAICAGDARWRYLLRDEA